MKHLFLLVFAFLTMASCSRSDDDDSLNVGPGYFVKYKANGTMMEDKQIKNPMNNSQWIIPGSGADLYMSSTGNHYSFSFITDIMFDVDTYPLKKGTYIYDENQTNNVIEMEAFYYEDPATHYTYSNYFTNFTPYKSKFTMNVTEVGDSYVSGTFSGSIVAYENYMNMTNSKVVTISEGSFKIPLEK